MITEVEILGGPRDGQRLDVRSLHTLTLPVPIEDMSKGWGYRMQAVSMPIHRRPDGRYVALWPKGHGG